MSEEMIDKTSLAFNIGITGHRDITDEEEVFIRKQMYDIFKFLKEKVHIIYNEKKEIYGNKDHLMRLITPLAEGADRIAASVALDSTLAYEIQCPLPMNRNDYMEDFKTEDSKREFIEFLSKASSVMELDFGRESIPSCYLDVGLILLEHIDVLIAVWDGNETKGIGGTADIIRRAEEQGIPVIWINRSKKGELCYINMSIRYYDDWQKKLNEYIRTIMIPTAEDINTISEMLDTFYKKDLSKKKSIKLYSKIVKFLSYTKKKENKSVAYINVSDYIKQYYSEDINNYLLRYMKNYERADKLALYYADIYRSASFMRALLPFLATEALAFGFYWNWGDAITLVNISGFFLQAVFLYIIIFLSNKNERLKWHKKFIDYRILAELFRQIIHIAPIGYASRGIRITATESSWYQWYYRNIIRSNGIPSTRLDKKSLELYMSFAISQFVNTQIYYHEDKISMFKKIAYRLNKIGFLFFGLGISVTFMRGLIYFLIQFNYIEKQFGGIKVNTLFNMLSMTLPAIGAVMFAILTQCGFENLEQKHETMKLNLTKLNNESNFIGSSYGEISSFILRVVDTAIREVSDWRVFLKSKSIKKT